MSDHIGVKAPTGRAAQASPEEILALLEAAEAEVHGILASAASSVERLSEVPVCSEKALKRLSGQYFGHVRKVQEVLRAHAHMLEDPTDEEEAASGTSGLQEKLAELAGARELAQSGH